MATQVLTNADLYVHNVALQSSVNAVALEYGAELVDNTVFGDTTRSRLGGLKTVSVNVQGYADYADPDNHLFSSITNGGSSTFPFAVMPDASTTDAYFFQSEGATYQVGATVGDMLSYTFDAQTESPLIRGIQLHSATETATGNGSAVQHGAVSAGQTIYAAVMITAASGTSPTLDLTIESDDNAGMTSPTTQLTFSQLTGAFSGWQSATGAITDDYWRVAFTIGGTTPSFTFVVFFGIL